MKLHNITFLPYAHRITDPYKHIKGFRQKCFDAQDICYCVRLVQRLSTMIPHRCISEIYQKFSGRSVCPSNLLLLYRFERLIRNNDFMEVGIQIPFHKAIVFDFKSPTLTAFWSSICPIEILYQTSYDKDSPNCGVSTSNSPSGLIVIKSICFFAACLSKAPVPIFLHIASLICCSGMDGECLQKRFPCSTRLAQRHTTSPEGRVMRR